MITLFGFGENFGLPEVSPYVTKTEIHLRMAGLGYVKETAAPQLSPKGQLPWIEDDGEQIADSHFIRLHLERKYGIDFDEGLGAAERAQAWAIERMIENHFGWTVVHGRWLIPENFAKGPAHLFDAAPEEIRDQLRQEVLRQVAENVRAVGVGQHAEAEVLALGVRSLSALAALLGERPFLMGPRPTGVDAVAFAMLAGLMTPHFDGPLRRRATTYGNLVAYVDRMMAGAFPEFAWRPLSRAADAVAA